MYSYKKHLKFFLNALKLCLCTISVLLLSKLCFMYCSNSVNVRNLCLCTLTLCMYSVTSVYVLSNPEVGRELEDAKEAWNRRKNYDPLAASGRKRGLFILIISEGL